MRDQDNRRSRADTRNVGCVETRRFPQLLVERVFPALHLTECPSTGERDSCSTKDSSVHHQQQDAVTDKVSGGWQNRACKLSWILESNSVLVSVISHEHHGAGYADGEGCADQRIETCPFQIGETKPLFRHTTLLEEKLPGGDRSTHDRDNKKHEAAGDAIERQSRHHGVVCDSCPIGMDEVSQPKPGQIYQAECDDHALPAQIASGDYHQRQTKSRYRHRHVGADLERAERKGDRSKLSDEGEKVDCQQIDEGEVPPPSAEPFIDHGGVTLAGGNPQSRHHLLHEVADG